MIQLSIDKAALARGELPIRIRTPAGDTHAGYVEITGPSRFVVDLKHPLMPEGTYAWVETDSPVNVRRTRPVAAEK
jgi:hypothetical protein